MTTDLRPPQPRERLLSLAETEGDAAGLEGAAEPALQVPRPVDRDMDHGAETEQPRTADDVLP